MDVSDKQRQGQHHRRFLKCFEEVKDFLAVHGRLPSAKDNPRLYSWLSGQRFRSRNGELEQWKIRLLDSIGCKPNLNEANWMANYNKLFAYVEAHPNDPLPGFNDSLHQWWSNQLNESSATSKKPKYRLLLDQLQNQI